MKEDITKLIMEVIDLVQDVPEEFRKSSFEVLLNHFLIQTTLPSKPVAPKKSHTKKNSEQNIIQTILNTEYDWASTGIKKLKGIAQYLKILNVVKNDFSVDTLSPLDITTILEQKFREKKTFNAIGMSLMESVGKYVDRIKEDKGYRYRITASGEERLNQILGGNKN